MGLQILPALLASIVASQQAPARVGQPDLAALAQAYDRCMATYAVRLSRTNAADEDIYAEAMQGCLPLKGRVTAAIQAQLPAAQASELLESIETQARPNFMAMIARIRSDRARRGE